MATYSKLVESLKRLYQTKKITLADVKARLDKGTINQAEYDYIIG